MTIQEKALMARENVLDLKRQTSRKLMQGLRYLHCQIFEQEMNKETLVKLVDCLAFSYVAFDI